MGGPLNFPDLLPTFLLALIVFVPVFSVLGLISLRWLARRHDRRLEQMAQPLPRQRQFSPDHVHQDRWPERPLRCGQEQGTSSCVVRHRANRYWIKAYGSTITISFDYQRNVPLIGISVSGRKCSIENFRPERSFQKESVLRLALAVLSLAEKEFSGKQKELVHRARSALHKRWGTYTRGNYQDRL